MPWEKGSGHADEKVCYKPGFICVYSLLTFGSRALAQPERMEIGHQLKEM